MKFVSTIVFSVVLLQQIMNLAVQADTQCTVKMNRFCDKFKQTGQLCICGTEKIPEAFNAILPTTCEKTSNSADPKDKECTAEGPEIPRCTFFCSYGGKSCSVANGCIGV
jgi:hypothetical protein